MNKNQPKMEFLGYFLKSSGISSDHIIFNTLAGDGSQRTFSRFNTPESDRSFIIMENTPVNELLAKENYAYLMIGKHLFRKGIPIPEIFLYDQKNGWFIMEDVGDTHLNDEHGSQIKYMDLYEQVIEILFKLQTEGSKKFNTEWCYQTRYYDHSVMIKSEADYFKDSFLGNYLGLKKKLSSFDKTFEYLSNTASKASKNFFLHRDFQARNIMLYNGKVRIIDWQGGRMGPLGYDLASLLIEAYKLTKDEKERVYDHYLQILKDYKPDVADNFKIYYPYLAIQRNLQILGAFSFLTKIRGKKQFEVYIQPAFSSLNHLLDKLADPKLSQLKDTLEDIQIEEMGKSK